MGGSRLWNLVRCVGTQHVFGIQGSEVAMAHSPEKPQAYNKEVATSVTTGTVLIADAF